MSYIIHIKAHTISRRNEKKGNKIKLTFYGDRFGSRGAVICAGNAAMEPKKNAVQPRLLVVIEGGEEWVGWNQSLGWL